ncbi:MAG: 50S ribosome-binding GTPase [Planctomycetia bacterium]|nr:50S ribosome-binding GTPase [Planctomycetia bacterium]
MTTTSTQSRPELEAAQLTPRARGAIACLGVRGVRAYRALVAHWRRVSDGVAPSCDPQWLWGKDSRAYFGLFQLRLDRPGADQVVLIRRTAEAFELHVHGGQLLAQRILEALQVDGASLVDGAVWERQVAREERASAELSAHASAWEGVGLIDALFLEQVEPLLSRACSQKTARFACAQRALWRRFFVRVNRALSSGEDEALSEALVECNALLSNGLAGRRLFAPTTVLILGEPNVGKSSLTNAILGFDRVLTSRFSGTTRDLVRVPLTYDGWRFDLIDSAGLRLTHDPLERQGVALASEMARRAHLALRVFEPTRDRTEQIRAIDKLLNHGELDAKRTVDVLNKTDLPRDHWHDAWRNDVTACRVSALTGSGVPELLQTLVHRALSVYPALCATEPSPVLWLRSQQSYLQQLRDALAGGDCIGARALLAQSATDDYDREYEQEDDACNCVTEERLA